MKSLFDRRWKMSWFRRLAPWIARLASPCPEIARLASARCERPLGWRERWKMKLHYLICDWCRRYSQQIRLLHQLAPQLPERAPQFQRRSMPPEAKERLKQHLQKNLGSRESL